MSNCEQQNLRSKSIQIRNGKVYLDGELYAEILSIKDGYILCHYVGSNRYMQGMDVKIYIR